MSLLFAPPLHASQDASRPPAAVDAAAVEHWRQAEFGTEALAAPTLPPVLALQRALDRVVEPLLSPETGVDLMRVSVEHVDVTVRGDLCVEDAPVARPGAVERTPHPLGTRVSVAFSVDVDGRAILEGIVGFLARAPRRRPGAGVDAAEADAEEARFTALAAAFVDERRLSADAPATWARALGVYDPISVDDDAARMAGLPAPIVPVGGVVALVWDAVLRSHVSKARALRRLRVWPRRPLIGFDRVEFVARGPDEQGRLHVRGLLPDSGDPRPCFVAEVELT